MHLLGLPDSGRLWTAFSFSVPIQEKLPTLLSRISPLESSSCADVALSWHEHWPTILP